MTSMLTEIAAVDRRAQLRQAGERSRRSAGLRTRPVPGVEIRRARADDAGVVARLAALDEAPPLVGPLLLASADRRPVAALSLADRRVVADPFVATAAIVSLLRVRAEQVTRAKPRRGLRWPWPRLRLA